MKYNTPDKLFKAICDPIRNKMGTTDLIKHQDIPEAMEECFDIVQKETKEKYCVKNIVNGENILVTDGLNEPIQNLKVFGKSWQNTTDDIPTPNPDYPQKIYNLGDDGDIEYSFTKNNLCPKNLLKKGWYEIGDILGEPTINDSYPNAVYGIPFKCRDDIEFTWNFGNTNADNVRLIIFTDGKCTTYHTITGTSGISKFNDRYAYVVPLFLDGVPDTCIIQYSDTIPIEDNSQPLTIQTPNGLKGIQVLREEDSNYTDEDCNYWACDYIDFKRGKYVQRIVEKVLDGSEIIGWYADAPWHMSTSTLFGTELLSPQEQNIGTYAMCDTFVIQNVNYTCNGKHTKAMYYSTDGKTFCVNADILFETQDGEGFKKFFSAHPTKIYAILETPIEHDLTEEEIAQYNVVMMNHPNTTILNDSNAFTELEYVVDPDILKDKLDTYAFSTSGTFIPENDTKTFSISGLPFTPTSLMLLCSSEIQNSSNRKPDNLYVAGIQKGLYSYMMYTDSSSANRNGTVKPGSTVITWNENGITLTIPNAITAKLTAKLVYQYYITGGIE